MAAITPDLSRSNRINFFKRLLGKCLTELPQNSGSWSYADKMLTIQLDQTPELSHPGGALRYESEEMPERVLLIHGDDGEFHAFRNECTHGRRRLDPVPGAATVQCCSLGKSTFGYDGERLAGSAEGDLKVFESTRDGDTLRVALW